MSDDQASPEATPDADELSSIGRRAAAQLIDSILVGLPTLGLAAAFGAFGGDGLDDTELLVVTAVQVVLSVVYETVAVAVWARTIGKALLGIRVVRSLDGGQVSWTYAGVRSLVPAVATMVPYIGPGLVMVVYLRAAMFPSRQGLHDVAAGTVVVRR